MGEHVSATLGALSPEPEFMGFADGDIIAWRMPEMMTSNTVHRTVVYSASARLAVI